jgi:hypothetical protein
MPKSNLHFKESSVLRGVKAAGKAGLVVSGFEIEPDGTIRIHAAPPGEKIEAAGEHSEWDAACDKPAA